MATGNANQDAIATGAKVSVAATTPTDTVDDAGIDRWELEASRRALHNLRTLLLGQPMLDLIAEQVAESDHRLAQYLAESDGKFTSTQVKVQIKGLHIQELMPTVQGMMAGASSTDPATQHAALDALFAAHPEHYGMPGDGTAGVIETMGGLPTQSRPAFTRPEDVPDFVSELIDPSYDLSMTGAATVEDGSIFTYVLQEYKDTDEGMDVSLRIWYPAAAPATYTEEHAHHYAVEFRNGARLAAAQLHK